MPIFVPAKIYIRKDLHQQYGGQQQGGISTPKAYPIVLLITGDSGTQYGYNDGLTDEGLFLYTGEGQVGPMEFIRGNAAIRDHQAEGKDLHLFSDLKHGKLRYIDQMIYTGYHYDTAPDVNNISRKTIMFELLPFSLVSAKDDSPTVSDLPNGPKFTDTLLDLRNKAVSASTESPIHKERIANVYYRSEAIRLYALKRSLGTCEGCMEKAPFNSCDGNPYLQVHDIKRLSDGGPDRPDAVAALCPNCHRRAHYSVDAKEFNAKLSIKVKGIEITDP